MIIGALLVLHVIAFSIIPLPDPSEARYATIAKHMAESGNYIMPQIWIKGKLIPYMGKPPFAFWMMAGAIKLFGANEFAVRLPAFIAYLLLLGMIFYIIKRYKSEDLAISTSLIAATTGGLYLMSGVVLVDIWLSLFSIGAVFLYYAFVHENSKKLQKLYSVLIFIFLALGFLTKGPVALIFFGLPVFFWTLLNNRWETLKNHTWITGILLFLLITLPWFILAEKSTPGFLKYFFLDENFYRFVSPDKSHDLYSGVSHHMFPGVAILFSLVVCLPWVLIQLVYYSVKKHNYQAILYAAKAGWLKLKRNSFNKNSANFDLFLTGLIAITLFWCISSHLMLYYMTLVAPLYAVWAADTLHKYQFPLKNIVKLTVILLALYAIAYIPAYFMINAKKSTRYIVRKATALHRQKGLNGKIIFIRRMNYSAYFYGGDLVLPHGKETVAQSFMHHTKDYQDIYAIKRRYFKRIPVEIKNKLHCEYKDHNWALFTHTAVIKR